MQLVLQMFFNHHNCRIHIPLDYSGKGTKSFDVLTGDQELEVRTATCYGPEIDQSQQAKSDGHVINHFIIWLTDFVCCDWSIPGP